MSAKSGIINKLALAGGIVLLFGVVSNIIYPVDLEGESGWYGAGYASTMGLFLVGGVGLIAFYYHRTKKQKKESVTA